MDDVTSPKPSSTCSAPERTEQPQQWSFLNVDELAAYPWPRHFGHRGQLGILQLHVYPSKKMRHNESLFEHFSSTVRTPCWHFQDVLRSHRIRAGDAIEQAIEEEFCIFRIATLAECDETLRLSQHGCSDEHDELFFGSERGKAVEHTDYSDPPARSNSRMTPTEPDSSASPS